MTIITKAIGEKKTADIVELPLVVDDVNTQGDAKTDAEGQYAAINLPGRYVLRYGKRANRLNSLTTACLFLSALFLGSVGVIGGVYIYRQYARAQIHRFRGWCNVPYYDADKAAYSKDVLVDLDRPHADSVNYGDKTFNANNNLNFFKEQFEIGFENENYEQIDVPDFHGGRQGRYIHDFNTNKTGIIDMDRHRCFVMPLNRERILPPRNLYDLVNKMYKGYYEVDTDIVRETMEIIFPPITDLSSLGTYIARECRDLPTYRLQKNDVYIEKRSVPELTYAQFAGKNIIAFDIVNIGELEAYEEQGRAIEPMAK